MRWLEVRRHSLTRKDSARGRGSHLSAEGVALARLVGESLGSFAAVVTSASPRAIETAVAMGFAVDETVELPSGYVPGEVDHHDQWRWPHPYCSYAQLLSRGGGLAAVAQAHQRVWTSVVEAVPDGAAALVVGHGGGIEPGLVACLPDADHESWGAPFGHCDGARLGFDDGRFVSVQFHRAPDRKRHTDHKERRRQPEPAGNRATLPATPPTAEPVARRAWPHRRISMSSTQALSTATTKHKTTPGTSQ